MRDMFRSGGCHAVIAIPVTRVGLPARRMPPVSPPGSGGGILAVPGLADAASARAAERRRQADGEHRDQPPKARRGWPGRRSGSGRRTTRPARTSGPGRAVRRIPRDGDREGPSRDRRRPHPAGLRQVSHEDQRGELGPGGQSGADALPPGSVPSGQQVRAMSAARIKLASAGCSVYATGQVCKASAETAKTISGCRRNPAAASAWPHSTVGATRLPAVRAIFIAPARGTRKSREQPPPCHILNLSRPGGRPHRAEGHIWRPRTSLQDYASGLIPRRRQQK